MLLYARNMPIRRHGHRHAVQRYSNTITNRIFIVYYGDYEASIGLDGELLAGSLPAKQFKIVVGWILFHEEELYKAWNLAVQGEHFDKIKPL